MFFVMNDLLVMDLAELVVLSAAGSSPVFTAG